MQQTTESKKARAAAWIEAETKRLRAWQRSGTGEPYRDWKARQVEGTRESRTESRMRDCARLGGTMRQGGLFDGGSD